MKTLVDIAFFYKLDKSDTDPRFKKKYRADDILICFKKKV